MTKEARPTMILRLLAEAGEGKVCDVSIPDALEFRRDQYGLSRTEFAALLGLGLGHYGEILNRKRGIGKLAMRRAYAIGVPAEVLLQPENLLCKKETK
jgi:antitoxin component HigA of HigAB toxin-antitoxin module